MFDVKCFKQSMKCLIWRHVCAAGGSPPTPHWELWTSCSTGKLPFTSSPKKSFVLLVVSGTFSVIVMFGVNRGQCGFLSS